MTLIGSKGGGGGTFKQRPDTLRSNDTFEALMGICAGPVKGPTRGLKSVTINGTPVEDETGKLNFENFLVVFADGDPAKFPQIAELRLGAGAAPVGINVSLTNTSDGSTPGPWVTRTVPNVNADFIDLRFVVSQLYRQDKKGIYEAEANLHVEMKPSGSTNWINPMLANPSQQYSEQGFVDDVYRLYVPAANYDPSGYWAPETNNGYFKIFGKTNSPAVHELRITVPNQGAYANKSWDIRVRLIERDTLDADPNFEKRTISWESASAGFNIKYGSHEDWRGVAWLQIYGKATDQINSTPEVAVVCDTLIVPVPPASVFNPDTRQYTGALWDGSWTQAFTTDPAWVINGLIVDSLHGLSSVAVGSTLNKWDALEASKWCSQLVPDGAGGMHPRYSMNLSINETIDAREFVQYLAGAVGGIAWEDTGGEWRLRMDKPENPVDIFTLETIEGDFSYANTDVDTRFNDITIVFRNEEFDYREDRVRVVSNAHIAKYGRKPTTIVAVGCTNRQEALRRGMLRLRAATREVRSVTFRTNRRGRLLERLDTILVADSELNVLLDTEFNTRSTGRIVAVAPDRSWIEVRDPLRLELGVAYSINFTKPNPDYNPNATSEPTSPDYDKPTLVQTIGLVNNSSQRGDVVRLYLASPLPTDVAENANLSLVANGLPALPKAYRVLDIEEDGEFFTISAIELDTGKWAAADNVTEDDTVFIAPDAIVPPPTNLVSYISVFDGERTARQAINLNWDRPASRFLAGFKVDYAVNGGPWIPFAERTAINSLELVDPVPGNYQFRVYSVDRRGALSEPAYNNRNVNEIDPGALVGLDKIDVEDGLIWGGAEPLDMGRLDNRLQEWDEVNGDGKPEDNATVGAPAGTLVGGVPAEQLVGQVQQVDTDLEDAKTQIDDLFATYGSTASAAASAQEAATSAFNAANQAANSQAARLASEGARDVALQAQANSEVARNNAQAAQSAAETARNVAQAEAQAAAGSASTAAGHATTATSKASEALGSASAAAASALVATSRAGDAANSASAANTSAQSAASSATQAGNSASAASSSVVSAQIAASIVAPSTFRDGGTYFSALFGDEETSFRPEQSYGYSYPVTSDYGKVLRSSNQAGYLHVTLRRRIRPAEHSRRFRLVVRGRQVINPAQGNAILVAAIYGMGNNWQTICYGGWEDLFNDTSALAQLNVAAGVVTVSCEFSLRQTPGVDPLGNIPTDGVTVGCYVVNQANPGVWDSGVYDIISMELSDITEQHNAQQAAAASAGSASSAAASESNAIQQASAAQQSANLATTRAGEASTFASQAATSASGAAGSASTASSQAALAASARNAAQAASQASIPDNFLDPNNWVSYNDWGGSLLIGNGLATTFNGGSITGKFHLPLVVGQRYRLTMRHRVVNQGGGNFYLGVRTFPSLIIQWAYSAPSGPIGQWQTTTVEFAGSDIGYPNETGISPQALIGYPNASDGEISMLRLENITSEAQSAQSAAASLTHSQNAAASSDAAGASASAAQSSRLAAEAANSSAQTAASNAASSSSAAGVHAATAQTNANLAATYRDQADGHRANALSSASAANGSAVSAAGSASSAATQASLAATYSADAGNAAASTFPRVITATSQ